MWPHSDVSRSRCGRGGTAWTDALALSGELGARTLRFGTNNAALTAAQLSAIKAKNPDVLYMPNYYTEVALAMKQAKDLGLNLPVLSGDGA